MNIHRGLAAPLLAGLMLMAWAAESVADQGWYLSPGGRLVVYDSDRNVSHDPGTGLQLGIGSSINERLNLEFHLTDDRARLDDGSLLKQRSARVDALWFLSRGGPWLPDTMRLEPYLVAGAGHRSSDISGQDDRRGNFAEIGVGTFLRFTPRESRARLRADIRIGQEWLDSGNGQDAETFNDISFNVGAVIPLGEAPPPRERRERPARAERTADCPDAPPGVPVDADGCELPAIQRLDTVRFDDGSTRLADGAHEEIDRIGELFSSSPRLAGLIAAYTAAEMSDAEALRLTQRRAEVVRAQLLERGVAPERIVARGYGKRRPPGEPGGDTARARDDGVELHLIRW